MLSKVLAFVLFFILFTNKGLAYESLNDGVKANLAGQTKVALQLYSTYDVGSPEFFVAINEIQKTHYRKKNWQRFFAIASYLRLQWQKKALSSLPIESSALEVLGLARHCLYEHAYKVAEFYMPIFENNLKNKNILQEAIKRVRLKQKYEIENATSNTHKPPSVFIKSISYWKVPSQKITHLKNPKDLRMIVEDQCSAH